MLVNELEDLKKSHRISHEICQRFVRLSCQKMVTSRGSANLRRNLLILQLLQRARRNLKEVPNECRALLDLNQPLQPPSFRNRSGTPRPSSPMSRRMGRSFQSQQTTPFRRPTINTSALADEKPSIAHQPISPPPVDAIKSSTILACKALDDEVFVSEKENKKLEDVEELFLAKVVLPSRPKPVQKAAEVREVVKQPLKSHRLEFPLPIRNINGRRDFFGIALPQIKPPPSTEIRPLSDTFTGKIESAPLHNVKSGFEVEEMPPCLFKCDEPKAEVKKSTEKSDRVVPRMTRNSVSLCLDSNDLKALDSEEEDCCQTDGDFESDSEQDGDFGYHRSSFKRRLRKRKTKGGMNSNIFTSEKRSKDSGLMLVDMELNHRKHQEDHCVPCISI